MRHKTAGTEHTPHPGLEQGLLTYWIRAPEKRDRGSGTLPSVRDSTVDVSTHSMVLFMHCDVRHTRWCWYALPSLSVNTRPSGDGGAMTKSVTERAFKALMAANKPPWLEERGRGAGGRAQQDKRSTSYEGYGRHGQRAVHK